MFDNPTSPAVHTATGTIHLTNSSRETVIDPNDSGDLLCIITMRNEVREKWINVTKSGILRPNTSNNTLFELTRIELDRYQPRIYKSTLTWLVVDTVMYSFPLVPAQRAVQEIFSGGVNITEQLA